VGNVRSSKQFEFTGAVLRDGKVYSSLCLDLDVASQGKTAVKRRRCSPKPLPLYLETCFENGMPICGRSTNEDPRIMLPRISSRSSPCG